MSDSCASCGGLIMKPNVSYGYAGPVCMCAERRKYWPDEPHHTATTEEVLAWAEQEWKKLGKVLTNSTV